MGDEGQVTVRPDLVRLDKAKADRATGLDAGFVTHADNLSEDGRAMTILFDKMPFALDAKPQRCP